MDQDRFPAEELGPLGEVKAALFSLWASLRGGLDERPSTLHRSLLMSLVSSRLIVAMLRKLVNL